MSDVINDLGSSKPIIRKMSIAPTAEEIVEALKAIKVFKA